MFDDLTLNAFNSTLFLKYGVRIAAIQKLMGHLKQCGTINFNTGYPFHVDRFHRAEIILITVASSLFKTFMNFFSKSHGILSVNGWGALFNLAEFAALSSLGGLSIQNYCLTSIHLRAKTSYSFSG